MTNPNDAVGTNAAYNGRTSVNAFNDDLAVYSRGVISGWACSPNSGLTVSLGGNGTTRDVAVAEDNAGNKTSINNISGSPISVTISAAPANNSRIDAIVAYVDNPATGTSTVADNPAACGLIVVKGTAAASPVAPTDSTIRTAITADGASGTTAYYVVLAKVTIASGTTDLTSSNITAGASATITSNNIDFATMPGNYSTSEVNTGYTWVDGSTIYKKTINFGALPSSGSKTVAIGVTSLARLIKIETIATDSSKAAHMIDSVYGAADPTAASNLLYENCFISSSGNITIAVNRDRSSFSAYVTIWYTKTN